MEKDGGSVAKLRKSEELNCPYLALITGIEKEERYRREGRERGEKDKGGKGREGERERERGREGEERESELDLTSMVDPPPVPM